MPRLFSAIEIPSSIAERLTLLRAGLSGARWIDPENYHLTLRFIGDVDRHTARDFTTALGEIVADPFELGCLSSSIHDSPVNNEPEPVTTRLIETTRLLGARLMTVDENLTKVAKIQGVDVLNIHDLDEALKPTVAVGERIRIALVRTGKEDHQAVGYLPDGTMIVANHAVAKIGTTADVIVVSTLQTASGMMVFAELYKKA